MSKALKRYLAADLKNRLGEERDLVVLRVGKLTVERANDLRNELRSGGAHMTVLRNRIAEVAFKELGIERAGELLEGMTAVAYGGEDGVLGVSRVLSDWTKKNKGVGVEVVGGYMEGNLLTAGDVQTLATMPSRDQLLGMIASAVAMPMQTIAAQINEMFAGIVRGVDAVREQKEQSGS